ncbi:MAG: SRPBCC family protein [Chloroflexota bacterium]
MSYYSAEASEVIAANPADIYAVLKDYHINHPAILPKQYFKELKVIEGGDGAGTVFETRLQVMGVEQTYRMTVTEPEPGRVIAERDEPSDVTTTFTVDPLNGGQQSRVTIHSQAKASPGIKGVLEQLFTPAITRRIFRNELKQLAEYMAE